MDSHQSFGIFNQIFFVWADTLMKKGREQGIKSDKDLFQLPNNLTARSAYAKLLGSKVEENKKSGKNHKIDIALRLSLIKAFLFSSTAIALLRIFSDLLNFVGPLVLAKIVIFLESKHDSVDLRGLCYSSILFVSTLLSAICSSMFNFHSANIMLKIKSSVMLAVYNKLMVIPWHMLTSPNPPFTKGEILNLASVDAGRISNFYPSVVAFFALPIQLIITLFLLYGQLGVAFLGGLLLTLIILPINKIICHKISSLNVKMLSWKDKRIKLISEVIIGIRMVKMQSWESILKAKIEKIRHHEMKYMKKIKYLDAVCVYFWASSPVLISISSFSLYVLMGGQLTTAKAFTSLALFSMLIMPLNALPWVLNGLIEAYVSVRRVQRFLNLSELDLVHHYTGSLPNSGSDMISMRECVFSHLQEESNDRSNLGPLTMSLRPGDFLGLTGSVGSGKSSFLSSIVGEMHRVSGQLEIKDKFLEHGIGFLPQEAWIFNATVRENILFGKDYDESRYNSVIDSCALSADIEMLPNGDRTIVGDRGMALSGGQKARIALARAIYQDFDVYLLDDPYSSVDAHVAQHLKRNCVEGFLQGKSKILSTHHTQLLSNIKQLIMLKDGKITVSQPRKVFPTEKTRVQTTTQMSSDSKKAIESNQVKTDSVEEDFGMLKEECEKGQVNVEVYKYYVRSMGIKLAIAVILFFTLMQATRTGSDWWLSVWTSSNSLDSEKDDKTSYYLQIFAGIALANSLFTMLRAFIFAYGGIQASLTIHKTLLDSTLASKMSFFDSTSFGRIINRFSSDITDVDDRLPFNSNIFLAQIFSLGAALFITICGIPHTFILILILIFPYYFIQQYYRWTARDLKRISAISLSPIYSQISETLSGLNVIRAFSASTKYIQQFHDKVNASNRCQYAFSGASQWLNIRLQLLAVLFSTGVSGIAILLKYWSIIHVNAGLVGLSLVYSLSITGLLNGVVQAYAQLEIDLVSIERIKQYLDKTDKEDQKGKRREEWPLAGAIKFESVSLRYKTDAPRALDNINLTIESKQHVGIVGRTGSGKSSLLQLLLRLVPLEEGKIFVDDVDINSVNLDSLRSSIFFVPQDSYLFGGPIRFNLDPFEKYSDEKIWTALKQCRAQEMVKDLGGLDAEISENGLNLSLGQRQLLCLSRALLSECRVICLDEITSSIDKKTDVLLEEVIRTAFKDHTLLIIAHKIGNIANCDRVLVMDKGRIAEDGDPKVLKLRKDSMFYKLWSSSQKA